MRATGLSGNSTNGNGGAGLASAISGTITAYAGGGGGGGEASTSIVVGLGGTGGGGNGGYKVSPSTTNPVAGTANTGGGGGGSWLFNSGGPVGAAGGSGIVIIRYPDTFKLATSTTGSPTITTSGGFNIYRWTSSGSITF
jgi:hypothetical protein